MSKSCKWIRLHLARYQRGELVGLELEAMESHLADCPECSAAAQSDDADFANLLTSFKERYDLPAARRLRDQESAEDAPAGSDRYLPAASVADSPLEPALFRHRRGESEGFFAKLFTPGPIWRWASLSGGALAALVIVAIILRQNPELPNEALDEFSGYREMHQVEQTTGALTGAPVEIPEANQIEPAPLDDDRALSATVDSQTYTDEESESVSVMPMESRRESRANTPPEEQSFAPQAKSASIQSTSQMEMIPELPPVITRSQIIDILNDIPAVEAIDQADKKGRASDPFARQLMAAESALVPTDDMPPQSPRYFLAIADGWSLLLTEALDLGEEGAGLWRAVSPQESVMTDQARLWAEHALAAYSAAEQHSGNLGPAPGTGVLSDSESSGYATNQSKPAARPLLTPDERMRIHSRIKRLREILE